MRADRFEGLESTQKSRSYYLDYVDDTRLKARLRADRVGGSYTHMFSEDVAHLLPWRRVDDGFDVKLGDGNKELETLVVDALPSQYGSAHDLEEAIRQFAELTAHELTRGPAYFELVLYRKPDTNTSVAFRLVPVVQSTISSRRRAPIQWVPSEEGLPTHRGLSYVELDPAALIVIEVDRETRRALESALDLWAVADAQTLGGATMSATTPGFSFSEMRRLVGDEVLKGTRAIGWDGRSLLVEGLLDPYKAWRHLQFLRLQLKFRLAILTGLQEAVSAASSAIGFDGKLQFNGLSDIEDIERAEAGLADGSVHIGEILGKTI